MSDSDDGKGGGGLFGKLKGAFFEDEPDKPKTASAPPQPAAPRAPAPPTGGYAPQPTYAPAAAADPEMRKLLEGDVQAAAKPAFSEFAAMSQSMAAAIPDERMRFNATLAALAARGVTLDKILFDVDECLEALDNKERENARAAEAARKEQVGGLEQSVAQKRQRIAALKAEMEQLEREAAQEQASIATTSAEIDETNRRFSATVAQYRAELTATKSKISHLGKGAQ